MARAITSPELALLRSDGQWSELFIAAEDPLQIFGARVNQSFTTYDSIAQLTYDGGDGTLADVLPGMTMLIGTAEGLGDKGMVRIRKAPTATVFYIGETSDIAWADNDYLTVIDEFGLWPRHMVVDADGVPFADFDIAYTDQHKYPDPVPVLGPDAVLWLPTGGTVSLQPDASNSWVLGGTITGYAWTAPDSLSITGNTTATPTITYDSEGSFYIRCTVTASNGKTFMGQRRVYVFGDTNPPIQVFQLEPPEGRLDDGGWSMRLAMYGEATQGYIRDRGKVILFAKDYYGATQQSIGPVTGYENVICAGWVDGESIEWDSINGMVMFTVHGPAFWLDQATGIPLGIKNVDGVDPTSWKYYQDLTVDAALWHFCHWRSTITNLCDVYLTGDTRLAANVDGSSGSLWQQLVTASSMILARPACDRYGRLFVEIDAQHLPVASRSGIPVVMTILEGDWMDKVDIERRTVPQASWLDIGGVSYDGVTETKLYSRAPGTAAKRYGRAEGRDKFLFADQAQANAMAGLMLGAMNNIFPRLSFRLAMANRMIDIAPRQYCQVDIAAEDTLRGFVCSAQKLLPRVVTFEQDPKSGALLTSVDFEGESTPENSVTAIPPQPGTPNEPPVEPPIVPPVIVPPPDIFPPPPIVPPPPPPTDDTCPTDDAAPQNGPYDLHMNFTLRSDTPVFSNGNVNNYAWGSDFQCYLRRSTATYLTTVNVNACWEQSTDGGLNWVPWVNNVGWGIRAYYLGAAGSLDATLIDPSSFEGCQVRSGYFSPAAATPIRRIEVWIEPIANEEVDDFEGYSLYGTYAMEADAPAAVAWQHAGSLSVGPVDVGLDFKTMLFRLNSLSPAGTFGTVDCDLWGPMSLFTRSINAWYCPNRNGVPDSVIEHFVPGYSMSNPCTIKAWDALSAKTMILTSGVAPKQGQDWSADVYLIFRGVGAYIKRIRIWSASIVNICTLPTY